MLCEASGVYFTDQGRVEREWFCPRPGTDVRLVNSKPVVLCPGHLRQFDDGDDQFVPVSDEEADVIEERSAGAMG